MSNQNQILDTCGCCEGIKILTPESVENLPGLAALAYRVGTHSSFKKSMQAVLSTKSALEKLTMRDDDDPAIALLDAWAMVLDILTFYQERIVNEGYLHTAKERRSVLELARHINYKLGPGVAAGTYLTFKMDEAPGAPSKATISVGTKVQSVPAQNELPQIFETVEEIEARVEWNALKPRMAKHILPASGDTTVYLKGTTTDLKEGDVLLFIGKEREDDPSNEKWALRKVKAIDPVPTSEPAVGPNAGYTKITLDTALDSRTPSQDPKIYALRQQAALFGHNAPDWRTMSNSVKAGYLNVNPATIIVTSYYDEWPGFNVGSISKPPTGSAVGNGLYAEYYDTIDFNNLKLTRIDSQVNFDWGTDSPAPEIASNTFSVRWSGWLQAMYTGDITFYTESDDGVRLWVNGQLIIDNWTDHSLTTDSGNLKLTAGNKYDIKLEYYENGGRAAIKLSWSYPGVAKEIIPHNRLYTHPVDIVHLDAVYRKILTGSWLILSVPESQEVFSVEGVSEDSKTNFSLSAKTTRLALNGKDLRPSFNRQLRNTMIYAQSEKIEIAETPITTPISGKEIVLDSVVSGIKEGCKLIITGKRIRAKINLPVDLHIIDGPVQKVQLGPGDEMIVMAPPVMINLFSISIKIWYLKGNLDINGKNMECEGYTITLDDMIIYTSSEEDDETVSELIEISSLMAEDDNHTKLILDESFKNIYDRATVTISANIARATHGETKTEVLGSGDGSQKFQEFELKQKPLTYVSAATASGTKTTLEIRVNDILWKEVFTFYGIAPEERVYITRIADDGKVTIQFGDGITGARLPTGTENVKAIYRIGTGLDGLLNAGQLSLLMTPQFGVKSVTNPLAPTGADDPERRDMARRNAPLIVLTLDRIVSLLDFEDFTRAFPGIGKARADLLWKGEQRTVHITVASADGKGVDESSDLYNNLTSAIDVSRHSNYQVKVDSFNSLNFDVKARVLVDEEYIKEEVLTAVSKALQEAFSFDARDFGQAVTPSEVMSVIQGIKGVIAVDLEELDGQDPFSHKHFRLKSEIARWDGETIIAAELLTINPDGIEITEMPS